MDDATIIKALRHCKMTGTGCKGCPYEHYDGFEQCRAMLPIAANRLEAMAGEIAELKADRDAQKARAEAAEAELRRVAPFLAVHGVEGYSLKDSPASPAAAEQNGGIANA